MRVCDIIANFVYANGIHDVFTVVGGGSMFLVDGLASHPSIRTISCHHEQAAAMAAVAYAKYKGIGCGFFTTGCGGTNAMTGVLHAWQDNSRCIFISGQCRRNETVRNLGIPIRQLGVQEADIVSLVSPITKYAVMVNDSADILYHLEKAFYIMQTGRPGPVWIDVPLDVQSDDVDEKFLRHFSPDEIPMEKYIATKDEIQAVEEKLKVAQRPVIIAGQGIRLANAIECFKKFIEKTQIPVVCSRLGLDVIPTEHPLNIGRIGNQGTRAANITVQNADFILVLGSRLSICSTGYGYEYFAREATIFVVDIDPYEHMKNTIKIDRLICSDIKKFLSGINLQYVVPNNMKERKEWAGFCNNVKQKLPVCQPQYANDSSGINMYYFMRELSKCFREDETVVTDAGSAVYVPAQEITFTSDKQRYITSGGQAEMGFTLPGVIGACVARNGQDVVGITGDGSFQMNIQELQTIVYHQYPIKLFIWNNDGYLSIRSTQTRNFNKRYLGTDKTCGISFPSLEKIAYAYGITYRKINKSDKIELICREVLSLNEPVICEIICERDQAVSPVIRIKKRLDNGKLVYYPLEEMSPLLPRSELEKFMRVKLLDEE